MFNTTTSGYLHPSGLFNSSELFILGAALLSIIFGLYNAWWILRIEIVSKDEERMQLKDDRHMMKLKEMQEIADLIANGA